MVEFQRHVFTFPDMFGLFQSSMKQMIGLLALRFKKKYKCLKPDKTNFAQSVVYSILQFFTLYHWKNLKKKKEKNNATFRYIFGVHFIQRSKWHGKKVFLWEKWNGYCIYHQQEDILFHVVIESIQFLVWNFKSHKKISSWEARVLKWLHTSNIFVNWVLTSFLFRTEFSHIFHLQA